jgi:hypothetical protein
MLRTIVQKARWLPDPICVVHTRNLDRVILSVELVTTVPVVPFSMFSEKNYRYNIALPLILYSNVLYRLLHA